MIKDQILLQNKLDSLKTRCFSCRSIGHFVYDCPLLHYIPDKEKIIKNYNQSNIQKRTKFIRRKITNQNSLKNKKKINEKSENIIKYMKKNTFLKNIPTLNSVKTQISIENETDEFFTNEKIHSPSIFTKNEFLINDENFKSKENFQQKKKSLKIFTSPQKKDFFSQEKSPISVGVTIERKIKEVLNKNGLVEPIVELDKVFNYKSYFPKGNIKQFIKNFGFDAFCLNSHLQQSKITAGFKIFNIEENESFVKNESPVLKETNIFQTKAKIFGKKSKKKSFYDIVFEVMNNEKLFKKKKKIIKNKK